MLAATNIVSFHFIHSLLGSESHHRFSLSLCLKTAYTDPPLAFRKKYFESAEVQNRLQNLMNARVASLPPSCMTSSTSVSSNSGSDAFRTLMLNPAFSWVARDPKACIIVTFPISTCLCHSLLVLSALFVCECECEFYALFFPRAFFPLLTLIALLTLRLPKRRLHQPPMVVCRAKLCTS